MQGTLLELRDPSTCEVLRLVDEEVPFVMRGLCRDWPAVERWSFDYLARKLEQTPGKIYKSTFRTREGVLGDEIPTKDGVREVLYAAGNFRIVDNMAIWLSARGNVTTLHYDGYSYDGLNVQVQGRKTFELYHPDLRCTMAPFLQGALPRSGDDVARQEVRSYTVELLPGDCLYTPRFWYHRVEAHADSTNVQYHFARRHVPAVETRAMRHYANNAWVVAHAPWLVPALLRRGISEYPDIVALYAARARRSEALGQATQSLLQMARLLLVEPRRTSKYIRQYNRKTLDELAKPVMA
jgi:Cupin-like domain